MALTDTQVRKLKAKLDARHVKTRKANGTDLHYVEGWHVIAEANRIFGYDAWDRQTLASGCVWSGKNGEQYCAAYTAKARVSVRAGDITIVREGSGTGEGRAPTPGQAHELALKGAETDATKRALATFGNPFGLALYDREQAGVRKNHNDRTFQERGPWILRATTGAKVSRFERPIAFAEALHKAMSEAPDIERLYAIWESNVEAVRAINKCLKREGPSHADIIPKLLAHLKACAIELATAGKSGTCNVDPRRREDAPREKKNHTKIDKSALAIGEPKRQRSKEHLRFVARQPCLICGRTPSQAHHVRFAQSRGLGLKVSDEFTVPLCATHHSENHTTSDEKHWWQERRIDPLGVARDLWKASTGVVSL